LVTALAGGDWIRHGCNVLITGATAGGKMPRRFAFTEAESARNPRIADIGNGSKGIMFDM